MNLSLIIISVIVCENSNHKKNRSQSGAVFSV
jgi:hypothetical protein